MRRERVQPQIRKKEKERIWSCFHKIVERKTQTDRQAYYVYAYYFVQKYVLYNLSVIKYLHEKRTIIPENDSTVVDSQERIFAYRRDS